MSHSEGRLSGRRVNGTADSTDTTRRPAMLMGEWREIKKGNIMRKFATLIVAAAMTVGTFGLTGCEQEETVTPVDTTTGTDTMETGTMEGDTMSSDAPTTLPAPTTAPTAP